MSIRLGVPFAATLTLAVGAAGATTSQATKAKPVSFGLVYSGSGSVVKTYHLKTRLDLAHNCGFQEHAATITLSNLNWRTEWKGVIRSDLSSSNVSRARSG